LTVNGEKYRQSSRLPVQNVRPSFGSPVFGHAFELKNPKLGG
jgi:hypothetical protein